VLGEREFSLTLEDLATWPSTRWRSWDRFPAKKVQAEGRVGHFNGEIKRGFVF
jgi:hypothetical protein